MLIKSYQDFLSISTAPAPSVPRTNREHHVESASLATRLVLDWDMLRDSVQLWDLMGTFTASEIDAMLTETEVKFNV